MNNRLSETDNNIVLDILVEQLGVERPQLTPEARLQEDLGADSLELVEIAMALDEHFNISIPDEALERISTVGDIFDVLSEFVGNSQPKT
jgi:acyl carrier protein